MDDFRVWKHPFHTISPTSNRKISGSMQDLAWRTTGCNLSSKPDRTAAYITVVYILISIPYILTCMHKSSHSLFLKVLILGCLLPPCIPVYITHPGLFVLIPYHFHPLSHSPKIQVLLRHVEASPRLEQALASPSVIAPGKKGRSHQEEPEAIEMAAIT